MSLECTNPSCGWSSARVAGTFVTKTFLANNQTQSEVAASIKQWIRTYGSVVTGIQATSEFYYYFYSKISTPFNTTDTITDQACKNNTAFGADGSKMVNTTCVYDNLWHMVAVVGYDDVEAAW